MKTQRGFGLNGVLIAVLIFLAVGTAGIYVVKNTDFVAKEIDDTIFVEEIQEDNNEQIVTEQLEDDLIDPKQGASIIPEEDRIHVTSPKKGDILEIGKIYNISWENYPTDSADLLTIALEANNTSAKIITSNASPTLSKYQWKILSESPRDEYRIQVYPSGDRNYIGKSETFSIVGEQLIIVDYPKPHEPINPNELVVITGKARNIFNEGEFDVAATYILDDEKQIVVRSIATCNLNGKGCDWPSGNLIDFRATLDLTSFPVCSVIVEFYPRDERQPYIEPVYILPLWLTGTPNCL